MSKNKKQDDKKAEETKKEQESKRAEETKKEQAADQAETDKKERETKQQKENEKKIDKDSPAIPDDSGGSVDASSFDSSTAGAEAGHKLQTVHSPTGMSKSRADDPDPQVADESQDRAHEEAMRRKAEQEKVEGASVDASGHKSSEDNQPQQGPSIEQQSEAVDVNRFDTVASNWQTDPASGSPIPHRKVEIKPNRKSLKATLEKVIKRAMMAGKIQDKKNVSTVRGILESKLGDNTPHKTRMVLNSLKSEDHSFYSAYLESLHQDFIDHKIVSKKSKDNSLAAAILYELNSLLPEEKRCLVECFKGGVSSSSDEEDQEQEGEEGEGDKEKKKSRPKKKRHII